MGKPAEYFNRAFSGGKHNAEEMCWDAVRLGATPNGVVASKLFPDQFDDLRGQIRLTDWFPDPIWVFMERHDKLGQAISWVIARQTQSWNSREHQRRTPEYSAQEIELALGDIHEHESRWARFFARADVRPKRFFYEEVILARLIHTDDGLCPMMAG